MFCEDVIKEYVDLAHLRVTLPQARQKTSMSLSISFFPHHGFHAIISHFLRGEFATLSVSILTQFDFIFLYYRCLSPENVIVIAQLPPNLTQLLRLLGGTWKQFDLVFQLITIQRINIFYSGKLTLAKIWQLDARKPFLRTLFLYSFKVVCLENFRVLSPRRKLRSRPVTCTWMAQ